MGISVIGGEQMAELLFGTGGTPLSAKARSTVEGIRRIAELGLGCMEVEFVQGVRMGEVTARQVAEVANAEGIALSAHAPYYINLNAREPEKVEASQQRILQAARIGALCGVKTVAFHAAFYFDDPPKEVYGRVKKSLQEVMGQLRKENISIQVRPEVMGKHSEIGTLAEVLDLCLEIEGVAPCIDVAHRHARCENFNSYQDFASTLGHIEKRLGRAALDDVHIHFSGIRYGARGEISHLNLKDSDFKYTELLKALRDYEVMGLIICESPNLEEDAVLLRDTYNSLPT
jgi:deoxyribonuclease-4